MCKPPWELAHSEYKKMNFPWEIKVLEMISSHFIVFVVLADFVPGANSPWRWRKAFAKFSKYAYRFFYDLWICGPSAIFWHA